MKRAFLAVVAAAALSTCSTAQAAIVLSDVISIDFGGTATGAPNWNIFTDTPGTSTSVPDLVRLSDGAGTGVVLTVTDSTGNGTNNSQGSGSADPTIYVDHIFANSGGDDTLTFTFSGLNDSLQYDLFGGSFRDTANANLFENTWVVGADSRVNTLVGGAVDNYETFTGLSSSGGEITFTITDNADFQIASLSELTITAAASAVPEPSSLSILGLGCSAL